MSLRAWMLVLLAVPFMGASGEAFACSCARATDAEQLEMSDAAFEAEIISVKHVRYRNFDSNLPPNTLPGQSVKMRVTKRLKGPHFEGAIVQFETMTLCCMCGVRVKRGERWLIYVTGEEPYSLSNCSGSRLLEAPGS